MTINTLLAAQPGGPPNSPHEARYRKNLAVLAKHHPHVLPVLDRPAPFGFKVAGKPSQAPNLWIDVGRAEPTALYASTDPMTQAAPLLEALQGTEGQVVCLLGVGLGYHAAAVIQHYAALNTILLVEAHPALFKVALTLFDYSALLEHPNVRLLVGDAVPPDQLFQTEQARHHTAHGFKIFQYPPALALAAPWYAARKSELEKYFNNQIAQTATVAEAGEQFCANRFANLAVLRDSTPMTALRDRFAGLPAIVVAAGPSLGKNIATLKGARAKAVIVAVDSAVAPLMQHDIQPHFVVTIDHFDYTFEKLAPVADRLGQSALLYLAEASPQIPNRIRFAGRFYAYQGFASHKLYNRILDSEAEPARNPQAAIHLALEAAVLMGCTPVITVGLDLAYADSRDHAPGVILHWGNQQGASSGSLQVKGVDGKMIPTEAPFLSMQQGCEQIIADSPGTVFIDATEGGAFIEGTECLALTGALNRCCVAPVAIDPVLYLQPHPVSPAHMRATLTALHRDAAACRKLITTYFKLAPQLERFLRKSKRVVAGQAPALPPKIHKLLTRLNELAATIDGHPIMTGMQELLVRHHAAWMADRSAVVRAEIRGNPWQTMQARFTLQKKVLRQKKEALNHMLTEFDKAARMTAAWQRLAQDQGRSAAEEKARFFFDHGYSAQTEVLLETLPGTSKVKQFYIGGCLLAQGNVTAGLAAMEVAVRAAPELKDELNRIVNGTRCRWQRKYGPATYQIIAARRLAELEACLPLTT